MYDTLKEKKIYIYNDYASKVYKLLSIMTVILRLIDLPRAYLT